MITVTKTIARKYNLIYTNTTVSNKNNRKAIHNHYAIYYAKSLAIITIFETLESLRKELSYNYNTKQYLQSYAKSIIIVTRYNY